MNNTDQIISAIKSFAHAIMRGVNKSEMYDKINVSKTRAELALNLAQYGVERDAFSISSYVYNAFLQASDENEAEMILCAFVSNDRSRYLVEEYRVKNELLCENIDDAIGYIQKNGQQGLQMISKANREMTQINKFLLEKVTNASMSVTGTSGAIMIKEKAGELFEKYSSLVEYYSDCTNEVKNVISDYTTLRAEVLKMYRYISTTLVNCFGDSIKVISPEIFDFDTIEWLETSSMLTQAQLKYSQLSDACGNLVNTISENFSNSVRGAINSYRAVGDKRMALITSGLVMLNHYIDSYSQTQLLGKEFLIFQNYLKHDVTAIKADTSRVAAIYKTVNDVYLPQVNTFFKHQDQVLTKELSDLMLAIYSNNEVVGLHNNQKALIEKCQNLEEEIVDLKQNISYYQSVIEQCKQTIAENKDEYNLAKSRKPSRPLFITNILTFGNAMSTYNRKISEWANVCKPVIDNYENLLAEIVVDSKELAQCQAEYSNKLKELQQTQKSLNNIVAQIKKCISVDENIKARIASHLKDLILLLKTAKYIISESLSKDLTKKVCIQEISLVELSENEKTAISKYTQSICKEFKEDPVVARDAEILTKEDEELNIMVGAYNQTVDNVASLIQTSIELDSMLKQQELADVEYEKQLSDIQTKYKLIMSQVDDKSNILKKAIAKINTADKFDDIKQGLISLANNDNASLSDEDIMNFLNDNKTLTI